MSTQESNANSGGTRVGAFTIIIVIGAVVAIGIAVVSQLETRRLRDELAAKQAAPRAKTEAVVEKADKRAEGDDDTAPATASATGSGSTISWDDMKPNVAAAPIPSNAVEALLASYDIVQPARVVPALEAGKPAGIKLFSIQPTSVYAKLGLENGDVIRRVNGLELSGPESAKAAQEQLKDATELRLDVRRRGKPLRLDFTISADGTPTANK